MKTSAYPDPVTQADAQALVSASSSVFSLDDLQGSSGAEDVGGSDRLPQEPQQLDISSIEFDHGHAQAAAASATDQVTSAQARPVPARKHEPGWPTAHHPGLRRVTRMLGSGSVEERAVVSPTPRRLLRPVFFNGSGVELGRVITRCPSPFPGCFGPLRGPLAARRELRLVHHIEAGATFPSPTSSPTLTSTASAFLTRARTS